jgi:hypothetical protein
LLLLQRLIEKEATKISIDSVNTEDSKELVDDLLTQIGSLKTENVLIQDSIKVEQQTCFFDQSTQTDDFLKGIKEFEGYVWHSDTKTAEIVLNDHWSLTIKRGGCDHFEMSASFMYDRILDIEKDKKQIFDSVIWITSLLEDFDGKDIKRVIDEGKVSITKRDEFNYHANLMDEKLYELYYFNFNNKDITTFNIGYYYN